MANIKELSDGGPDGTRLGQSATDKLGFYGKAPIVQRASSNQVSSVIASSTDFTATHLAVIQEIMNTLTALGIWKGAA